MTDPNVPASHEAVTTDAAGQPTNTPQPKVVAAAAGATVGAAVSTVGVWIIEASAHIDIPAGVEAAIAIIVTAGLTFLSGWLKRPSANAS